MSNRSLHRHARMPVRGGCRALALMLALLSGCGTTASPRPATPPGQGHPAQEPAPSRPVCFQQEEPWRSNLASFNASLGLARPPRNPQDLSALMLELRCTSGSRKPGDRAASQLGPLAAMSSIRIYHDDDQEHAVLVCPRSGISYATATVPGFEYDGRGAIVSLMECISIPFVAQAGLVSSGHPYHVHVICLDQAGRTMASEEVSGDLAETALTPLVAPPGSWTFCLLPPRPGPAPQEPACAQRQQPQDIGMATVEKDGTLELVLRSVEDDGTIAEALLVITTSDRRYPAMAAHLHHPRPGTSCPIPPLSVKDGTAAPAAAPISGD